MSELGLSRLERTGRLVINALRLLIEHSFFFTYARSAGYDVTKSVILRPIKGGPLIRHHKRKVGVLTTVIR